MGLSWGLWSIWNWVLYKVTECIYLHTTTCNHSSRPVHLLMMYFFLVVFLVSLWKKLGVHRYVNLGLCLRFYSIKQHICSVSILYYTVLLLVQFEIWNGDISIGSFIIQKYFKYPAFVCVCVFPNMLVSINWTQARVIRVEGMYLNWGNVSIISAIG